MNMKEIVDLMAARFQADLPALLLAEPLADFDEYLASSPLRSDDLELCVYPDFDNNDTENRSIGVIVMVQLFAKDLGKEYDALISPYIAETFIPDIFGMTVRTGINTDYWPIDVNGGSSFVFYNLGYNTPLDDCDD